MILLENLPTSERGGAAAGMPGDSGLSTTCLIYLLSMMLRVFKVSELHSIAMIHLQPPVQGCVSSITSARFYSRPGQRFSDLVTEYLVVIEYVRAFGPG